MNNSMTTLDSHKVHHLRGCRDIGFLKKLTYSFLDEVKKLAIILENKAVQNLNLKECFNKTWSPTLIFFNEKKRKNR